MGTQQVRLRMSLPTELYEEIKELSLKYGFELGEVVKIGFINYYTSKKEDDSKFNLQK